MLDRPKRVKQETKGDLRRRWEIPEVATFLLAEIEAFIRLGSLASTLDLRGASVGMDGPLAYFRLGDRDYKDLDLSFGSGALMIRDGSLTRMRAREFAFDRATHFAKATLLDCDLSKFKGRFDATDVRFIRCDLSGSTFRGGLEGYGFKRCTFEDCNLAGAVWRNAALKASRFVNCSLLGTRFEACYVAGLKLDGAVDLTSLFASCDIRSIYLNGLEVPNAPSAV